jgi:hypothetical protein
MEEEMLEGAEDENEELKRLAESSSDMKMREEDGSDIDSDEADVIKVPPKGGAGAMPKKGGRSVD